jgi:hypothetical protein
MARVNDAEVRLIIDIDTSITDLTPFITIANLLVTDKLGASSLSVELLKEIERWLAAHFVAMRDQRVKSESIGGISTVYTGTTGQGLFSTLYGQTAMTLDTTGILTQCGMKRASFDVEDYTTS